MPAVSEVGFQQFSREEGFLRLFEHDVHSSPTAKMETLRGLISQQGYTPEGMNWRLLLLEWQYDLDILFGNVRNWMSYVDRQFDPEATKAEQPGEGQAR